MSTILDALKKVERDRESPHDELLEVELSAPPPRRGIPTRVIVACASIGFAAGIGLALWRDTAPLQQATSPPPPAPVIDVPAPPPLPQRPPPPAANAPQVPAPPAPPVANAVPPPAPPAPAVANAVPPPAPPAPAVANVVPPPAPPAANAVPAAPAPNVGAPPQGAAVANAPPNPAPPPAANAPGAPAFASADHGATALEPSPFGTDDTPAAARGRGGRKPPMAGARGAARNPAPAPPDVVAAVPAPPPAPPPLVPPLAALPPPAPAPPVAPVEAEPAQPPPVTFDTGRSPPGSPRVALTFLQWSADPERRFALISIDGSPTQRVREGDTASGLTVAEIMPTGVQFKREGQVFMIRPRH